MTRRGGPSCAGTVEVRWRHLLIAACAAGLIAPVTILATAWVPASGAAGVPSAAGLQAAASSDPTWSHSPGRAWLMEFGHRDPEHRWLRWVRGVPSPPGLAGFTGDAIEPAPWWSRLRQPPTDDDLAAGGIFEAAWGWPAPVLSMSVPAAPMRPMDWAGAADARTYGTPPARVYVLPARPVWRGMAIAGLVHWVLLFVVLLAAVRLMVFLAGRRGRRRIRLGACAGCGHLLPPATGAASPAPAVVRRCPECGQAAPRPT